MAKSNNSANTNQNGTNQSSTEQSSTQQNANAQNTNAQNGASPFGFPNMMDFSKFMPNFNTQNFNVPAFDVQAMMETNRRNAEAFTQAGQRAMQAMQAIMQRQNEMVRETWQETAARAAEVMAVASPQEKFAKQSEVTKASFEKAVSNSRELTELLTKCNVETAEAFTGCLTEAMGSVRTACTTRK
jgi:phasin family protein